MYIIAMMGTNIVTYLRFVTMYGFKFATRLGLVMPPYGDIDLGQHVFYNILLKAI